MTKGINSADEYVFKLTDDLKVMAENELRETAATRDFALNALREWIESNPRIAAARLGESEFESEYKFIVNIMTMMMIENIATKLIDILMRSNYVYVYFE